MTQIFLIQTKKSTTISLSIASIYFNPRSQNLKLTLNRSSSLALKGNGNKMSEFIFSKNRKKFKNRLRIVNEALKLKFNVKQTTKKHRSRSKEKKRARLFSKQILSSDRKSKSSRNQRNGNKDSSSTKKLNSNLLSVNPSYKGNASNIIA